MKPYTEGKMLIPFEMQYESRFAMNNLLGIYWKPRYGNRVLIGRRIFSTWPGYFATVFSGIFYMFLYSTKIFCTWSIDAAFCRDCQWVYPAVGGRHSIRCIIEKNVFQNFRVLIFLCIKMCRLKMENMSECHVRTFEMEKREKLTGLNALHSKIYIRNREWLESLQPSIYLPRETERGTLQRNLDLYIPRKGMPRPQSQFHIHVSVTDIPIFGRSRIARLISSQKHECKNLDCSRAVPFLGIFLSNCR